MEKNAWNKTNHIIRLFISLFIFFKIFNLSLADAQTGSISGTISEIGTSNPIVGAMVYVSSLSSSLGPPATDITDSSGAYTITGLSAGDYYVRANPSGQNYIGEYYNNAISYTDADVVTVTAGCDTTDINFELAPGGQISGIVTDSNNEGIANIWIRAYSNACYGNISNSAITDTSGAYTIMGLPAGTAYLSVLSFPSEEVSYVGELYDDADSCEDAYPVPVNIGLITENINFRMEMAGSISGTVFNSDGITPVADIQIEVYSEPCAGILMAGTFTDAAGEYYFNGLPPGNIYVKALSADVLLPGISPTNYLRGWYDNSLSCEEADPVAITAGTDVSDINFMLFDDTDSDEDGMPDQWEVNYFGDILSRDGAGDDDNDGVTDLQEYKDGTVPASLDTDPVETDDGDSDNDSGGGGGGGGGIFGAISISDVIGYHLDRIRKDGTRVYMPVTEGFKALKGAQTQIEGFAPGLARFIRRGFESLEERAESNKDGALYKTGTHLFPFLGKIAEIYLKALDSEELMTNAYRDTTISIDEYNSLHDQGVAVAPHAVTGEDK